MLSEAGKYFVLILPNNDPGSDDILNEIETLNARQFRVLPSMRFHYFSELLRNAQIVVGNSSMGVREAPFLGIPSIDIGTRQNNRAKSPSIKSTSPYDQGAIAKYLQSEWGRRYPASREFGIGHSASNFRALLGAEEFWSRPIQKFFSE